MPIGDAARIRKHLRQLVEDARSAADPRISLRVGAVRDDLGLDYSEAILDICQVLETRKFQTEARVELLYRTNRPRCGVDSVFRFNVLD